MDDSRLIDDALAGDSSAFGRLVGKYQDRLFNTLAHVVGSPDQAADIAQDAFVQAFVKLETFRGQSAFYTWLYRIAFNLAISRRRRERPSVSLDHGKAVCGQEPLAPAAPVSERMEREESVRQVHAALAAVSEEHRTVLVLREMEGHSYEVIGEMLELPLGTVRSRLHRARLELREKLSPLVGAEPTRPLDRNGHATPRHAGATQPTPASPRT